MSHSQPKITFHPISIGESITIDCSVSRREEPMPTAEDTDETARIMPALKLNLAPTCIDPTQVSVLVAGQEQLERLDTYIRRMVREERQTHLVALHPPPLTAVPEKRRAQGHIGP